MKKHLSKTILAFFILMICGVTTMAQDIIYKKDKTTLKAKITEVGTDEIKFYDFDNLDGPQFTMSRDEISRIVFSNGREMVITPDPYSVSGDADIREKRHAVKFEFFSPLTQDVAFGYEYVIRVGLNFEGKIGIIGPGLKPNTYDASGAFVKAGPKFLLTSDYVVKGMSYSHAMRGRYLKPEISVSIYSKLVESYSSYGSSNTIQFDKVKYGSYGLSLVYGRQVILGKVMTMDWYFGLGYAFHSATKVNSNKTTGSNYNSDLYKTEGTYDYSHIYFGKNFPMIMSAGITIGYIW